MIIKYPKYTNGHYCFFSIVFQNGVSIIAEVSFCIVNLICLFNLFVCSIKAAVSQILTILLIFYFTYYVCSNMFSGW